MTTYDNRLSALRGVLGAAGLDGFIVTIADEHGSEYVGAYAQRLHWLTGFAGSAGTAIVLANRAAFLTDGRYTLQAVAEVDGALYDHVNSVETPLTTWLAANIAPDTRIGFDPWLVTERTAQAWRKAVEGRGAKLIAVTRNPVDAIWSDRPAPSPAPLTVQPEQFAGPSAAEKRTQIAATLETVGADVAIVTALDGVAWAFNIRGLDVARTPVALAFAILHRDGTADLFVDEGKLTPDVRAHLGNSVRVSPYAAFDTAVGQLAGMVVLADPDRTAHAVFARLADGGARILEARDPTVDAKAIKSPAEIAGARAAHERDGAALTRFLRWVSEEAPRSGLDEITAAARLQAFRAEGGLLKDLSFDTIMGSGPNGAIMHYRVSPETNRTIHPGELLLIDSGGQYQDGTTDVTRTIAIGQPTPEMVDRFTRVLQGHIAVASTVFPHGARGCQLDGLARRPLWSIGTDYAHGTGHGVGSYLAVHEGPQRIAAYGGGDEPLKAGMILSNEPGYYKPGHYGIRIENLVLIRDIELAGAEKPMLGFENLTLAPIDRALIDPALLDENERDWLNAYHALVHRKLAPLLPPADVAWLAQATRAL